MTDSGVAEGMKRTSLMRDVADLRPLTISLCAKTSLMVARHGVAKGKTWAARVSLQTSLCLQRAWRVKGSGRRRGKTYGLCIQLKEDGRKRARIAADIARNKRNEKAWQILGAKRINASLYEWKDSPDEEMGLKHRHAPLFCLLFTVICVRFILSI